MNELQVIWPRRRSDGAIFDDVMKGEMVTNGDPTVGGDVRVAWDTDNEDECRAVGKLFDELKGKGFRAVKVGDDGKLKDGEKIEKFVGAAGRMVMLAPMMGGGDAEA